MPKAKPKKAEEYKLVLEVNNTKYTSYGENMLEAIDNLGLHYTQVKTKGVMKVTRGGSSHERFLLLPQLRRLLVNPLIRKGFSRFVEDFFRLKHQV